MHMRALPVASAFLALASLLAPTVARAEDAPPADALGQAKALLADADAAEKAKDDGALMDALKKMGPLYKQLQDESVKGSILKTLGSALKSTKFPAARKQALETIVETEDGKDAWRVMQGAYPDDDVDDPERFNVEFVKAVGALHPDGAIDRLLETVKKAKQVDLAAAAVTALGNYGASKQRERVLLDLAKAGKNMVPANSKTQNASAESRNRWGAISGPLGKAFDTLTGDTVGDPLEWFKRIDEAKKNPKSLFKK